MAKFEKVGLNPLGRDWAVGDIHGHFERLQHTLDAAGFDPARDRLFSVGDLVDRGPDSDRVLEWLDKPWFFAVQGNHELLTLQFMAGDPVLDLFNYRISGGGWFIDAAPARQKLLAERFAELPVALEVQTVRGPVGLVHANCPFSSWTKVRDYLQGKLPTDPDTDEIFQWSRHRLKQRDETGVRDIRAVIVGHTPLRQLKRLGNVYHIDTAGWSEGYFTLLDLTTLRRV